MKWLILVLFLSLAGCQSSDQQYQENVERAIVQLNLKHFDAVITILQGQPQTDQVKDILASAYAAKGGFDALYIADYVNNNKDNPLANLYLFSRMYSVENIKNLDIALSYIYVGIPVPESKPVNSNVKYATIEVYKASQLILKNYYGRTFTTQTDLCEAVDELDQDLRTIVVSLNKALLALKYKEPKIYGDVMKIEETLKINPAYFEEDVISDEDILNTKHELGKFYQKYIGTIPDSCNE